MEKQRGWEKGGILHLILSLWLSHSPGIIDALGISVLSYMPID